MEPGRQNHGMTHAKFLIDPGRPLPSNASSIRIIDVSAPNWRAMNEILSTIPPEVRAQASICLNPFDQKMLDSFDDVGDRAGPDGNQQTALKPFVQGGAKDDE